MNGEIHGWAARLLARDRCALEPLRLLPGVEAAQVGDQLWVRGPVLEGAAAMLAASLPAVERFEWLADGMLRLPGARLPCGRLAEGAQWRGLTAWLPLELPPASPDAIIPAQTPLRLVRGGTEESPDALLLDLAVWVNWAVEAPAARLHSLRFAAETSAGSAKALVLGQPLPPLPGLRLFSRAGVMAPLGWQWQPAMDAAVLRRLLGLRADECALWPGEDALISIIPAEAIVPASRSAARLTRDQARVNFPVPIP